MDASDVVSLMDTRGGCRPVGIVSCSCGDGNGWRCRRTFNRCSTQGCKAPSILNIDQLPGSAGEKMMKISTLSDVVHLLLPEGKFHNLLNSASSLIASLPASKTSHKPCLRDRTHRKTCPQISHLGDQTSVAYSTMKSWLWVQHPIQWSKQQK